MSTMEKVERVVAPVVRSSGLELVDVEVQSGTVRITVDRPGGVDLDAIGSATSAISRALDDADAVPGGRYELRGVEPGTRAPLAPARALPGSDRRHGVDQDQARH